MKVKGYCHVQVYILSINKDSLYLLDTVSGVTFCDNWVSAINALYPTVWGVLVGLSICNFQEGGADNMKSIGEPESIGICWAIRILEVLLDRSSNTCLSMSSLDSNVGYLEVDKAIYFWAICCLSSELYETFKELIDWVKLMQVNKNTVINAKHFTYLAPYYQQICHVIFLLI